jgi:protein SCO1/2
VNRRACFLVATQLAWLGTDMAVASDNDPRVQISEATVRVEDFSLTDQDGRPFGLANLRGRDTLVFFGFTRCTNTCPAAMFKMKLMAASLEEAGESSPAVVLISVDGDRDTPAVLKDYLQGYPKNFIGLTGDPKAVRGIAAGFKAVFFKGLPYDDAGHYQVEHTSMIYLVDADGRIRATFVDAPVEVMAATTRLITAQSD